MGPLYTNGAASVGVSKFTDAAGNDNTASNTVTLAVDTLVPTITITITSNKTALKAGETATLTFILSEAASNFEASDVTVAGGTLSNFTGSGSSYTATFTPTASSTTSGTASVATSKFTNATGNDNTASNTVTMTVDTLAPTVTHTSAAYTSVSDILVLTGINFDTLLESGETASTDIKSRLDWSKLSWDINGDNATTADVSFAVGDITSAKVTDSTHLTVALTTTKGAALEATSGYGGTTADTLDISAGFAKDTVGNAATTDAVANAPLWVSPAGEAVIDLGAYGKLIAPVQVEGKWYYYWDRSGDGTSADNGSLNGGTDRTTHDVLDGIFNKDITGVTNTTVQNSDDQYGTTDTYRFATLNGVQLALPTMNGGIAYPNGIDSVQPGTAVDNGTTSNPIYDEYLAIWDAYNGTGTGTNYNGRPLAWHPIDYWSSTPSDSGHALVSLTPGFVYDFMFDDESWNVALQVLSPSTPSIPDTTAPTVTHSSATYSSASATLVLTGTNFNTILENGDAFILENGDAFSPDIKSRLDWSKLSWDINGDDTTTADVSFAVGDISSAKVTDSTHLTVVLTTVKGTELKATSGYGGIPVDTLDISAGFARDLAGNAAINDAVANAVLTILPLPLAGDAEIDLGEYGKLIAPVQVEGKWYYYWDLSGDGTSANIGSLNVGWDFISHDVLDAIFTSDINGIVGGGGNTTDTYRFATLNGVQLALPTANGGIAYPNAIDAYQPGTAVNNGTTNNPIYDEYLAIWDAYNGTGTNTHYDGTPSAWQANIYGSATPSASGHAGVSLSSGYVWGTFGDDNWSHVALQML